MNIPTVLIKIIKLFKLNNFVFNLLKKKNKEAIDVDLPEITNAFDTLNDAHPEPVYHVENRSKIKNICYDAVIIIGAYNAQKYLKECLDSVFCQKTKYKYKVIIINDGSTDKSLQIIDSYLKYSNIEVINYQVNKGLSAARNRGLEYVESEYIMFVDADDILCDNAVEEMLNMAYKEKADLVVGSYTSFVNEAFDFRQVKYFKKSFITKKEIKDGYPWGKLFKTNLFYETKFFENYLFEDTILPYLIYPKCKKISSISKIIYHYRINFRGVTQTTKKSIPAIDSFWITKRIVSNLRYYGFDYNQYMYETTLRQIRINYMRTRFLDENLKKSIFVLSSDLLENFFSEFSTNDQSLSELANSLKTKNIAMYELSCLLLE